MWRLYELDQNDNVSDTWDNLATVDMMAKALSENGRVEEAEPLVRSAHAMCLRVFGIDHASTLDAATNLAFTLTGQSKHAEAETLFRFTLDKQQRLLGEDHPDALDTARDLAECLDAQGKKDETASLYQNIAEKERQVRNAEDIQAVREHLSHMQASLLHGDQNNAR